MAAPRATAGEPITAQKWNHLCEAASTGFAASGQPRDYEQMNNNRPNPSFLCSISMRPPYDIRIMPGWLCIEGGVPFLPSGMHPHDGSTLPYGSNVYLNLYTRRSRDISSDPGNPSQSSGDGVEATAWISAEPSGPMEGWAYSPIMLSEFIDYGGISQCLQHWASDIFISAGGGVFAASIPVYIRTRPETGWEPNAHNGLECTDESTPDKWQYALALRHADEFISYDPIAGAEYQHGGLYQCYVQPPASSTSIWQRPHLEKGMLVFPLANQDTANPSNPSHTYGLVYGATFTDELEPYVKAGVVYIPRCNCGSGVGSSVDPSGGGSYEPGGGGYIPLPQCPANLLEP